MKNFITKQLSLFLCFTIAAFALVEAWAADHSEREWESAGGKFKITGTFKEYHARKDEIVLVKKDGKEVIVPLAKLSDKDQQYVKKIADAKNANVEDVKSSLTEADEKIALQLVEELRSQFRPTPSPKWEKVWSVPVGGLAQSVSYSRSPDYVAVAMRNGSYEIRNMADGSPVNPNLEKSVGKTNRIVISPDGKHVMNATWGKGIIYWELESGKNVFRRGDPKARFRNAAMTIQNGKTIFVDSDLTMHIYPEEGGEETLVPKEEYLRPVDYIGKKNDGAAEESAEDDDPDADDGDEKDTDKEAEKEEANKGAKEDTKGAPKGKGKKKKRPGTNTAHTGINISPDSKKYVIWQYKSQKFKFVNLDDAEAKHTRSAFWFNTTPPKNPNATRVYALSGGITTNTAYAYLMSDGRLGTFSTKLPQNDHTPGFMYFDTPMSYYAVNSLHSADGKYAAFCAGDKILLFPSDNIGEWTMVGGPHAAHDATWLHPDMKRIIGSDSEKNLVLWKAGNPDYIKDIGTRVLFPKLVQEAKYDIIDRAYSLLEKDPEANKYSLLSPWTEKFMDRLRTEFGRQISRDHADVFKIFQKWHDAHKENRIGYIYWSDELVAEAWSARGGGWASEVTEEGWKEFHQKMTKAKAMLEPVMRRKQIPVEAISNWLSICQATGWNQQEVMLGIVPMIRDYPLHCKAHTSVAFSLLPRWHGRAGDSEKYCEKIADSVDPKYGDAVYAVSCGRLIRQEKRFIDAELLFNENHAVIEIYDDAKIDWERIRRGTEQLIELFPEDPQTSALALYYAVCNNDRELALKSLKLIDEKHDGIVTGSRLSYYEVIQIRKALKK